MVDQPVVESVKRYLEQLLNEGLKIDFGVIFGSYACGKADVFSDIDVLLVSTEFDKPIPRKTISQMWRIAARIDSRIEPVPCGLKKWETDVTNVLIDTARTSGQMVSAA